MVEHDGHVGQVLAKLKELGLEENTTTGGSKSMTSKAHVHDPKVDDPSAYTHKFVQANGIRIHYVEEGTGPLVILLHGVPFLWYLWRHQIRPLAAAGYRVVVPDLRGYGQTDGPQAKDMTLLVGDVVGLMQALGETSAVIIGQDGGTLIGHACLQMRLDLFRGLFMMCTPPAARGAVKPSLAAKGTYKDLVFYQGYVLRPGTMEQLDVHDFLKGIYYSTSGAVTESERWRWVWTKDKTFTDTYTVPKALPPHLSQQALDYYVSEFTRAGLRPAFDIYAALGDRNWEVTSFLEGVVIRQPAVFVTGALDPSVMPNYGIDRQGPVLAALPKLYSNLEMFKPIPGVGHTPPEEAPQLVTEMLLKFLAKLPPAGAAAQ
jgi:pimeloyl-ACP methyl ester carboxylesterase